ncbi:MAG: hypothetical protein M3169_09455 [Candidatus Eremiobacteraeota bacterium]|nr:hypothetical protein [Candidatus Eremiobacteraeota bacterium]
MIIRSSIAAVLAVSSCLAAAGAAEGVRPAGPVIVALNPQPEPPGIVAHVSGYVIVALNPQPEPPGDPAPKFKDYATTSGIVHASRAEKVALNPQPEPPGIVAFDARRLLPPGPCRTLLVTVDAEGARMPYTTHAVDTAEKGKCAYKVVTPGAKAGSRAAVKFSRD